MLKAVSLTAILLLSLLFGLHTPDLPRAELQSRYGLTPQNYLQLERMSMAYKDTGPRDAPAVLLLHGFGSSLQTWDEWSEKLELNYRVIRLDLPGFGMTGPSPDHDYSEAQDLKTLTAFVDTLGLSKLAIIGHSMGGKMAWSFAAAHPERVTSLVLMAPDGFPKPEDIGTRPYATPAVMGAIKYILPPFVVQKSIEPAFADVGAISPSLINRYHDMLRAPGVRAAILDRGNQTIYTDPVPRLKAIKAPTLLIWGAEDRMIPSTNARNYESVLENSQTLVLPKLGHLIQEEQPERGLMAVLEFLRRTSGTGLSSLDKPAT